MANEIELDTSWYIFTGDKASGVDINELNTIAPPPPWRKSKKDSFTYLPSEEEKAVVNAAIYLRRPLLVTGKPGVGKSSLAYAIADELGLPLHHWTINSKSTLESGLYSYDAMSRLHDAQLASFKRHQNPDAQTQEEYKDDITKYLKLEPLGLAFASAKKSVLLIDEFDKSDIDLPNDLLHILEENKFEIDVLKRYSSDKPIQFQVNDETIEIANGEKAIDIDNFPIIIITSNGERDFPPAFMRRCLHHDMKLPNQSRLVEIVAEHLNMSKEDKDINEVVEAFVNRRDGLDSDHKKHELSTDQLLNALYLRLNDKINLDVKDTQLFKELVWRTLNE
jgi:MoxR-like ATPase